MVKSVLLQEELRRALNRINSGYDARISVVDADGFLNQAIDTIFENLATRFESNTNLRNHLRQLEVPNKKLKPKKIDKNSVKVDYPSDLYMLTRQFVNACKGKCEKILDVYMIQSSDLTSALKDPNWQPSFDWEQVLAEDYGNSLILYHNCDFDITEVSISYLRKPKHIATPSLVKDCDYIKGDGTKVTKDQDFEIDSTFFWRKVVDLAVLNILAALGDAQDYQIKYNNIMALDRMFLQ